MIQILFDEWLYLKINGVAGSYGKDEVLRNYKRGFKSVALACLDVSVKLLPLNTDSSAQKEALIAQACPPNCLIMKEWVSPNLVQLMIVDKSKIEDAYAYFKPTPIVTFVAYQTAIRAFLKSNGLLNDNKTIIMVDDIKTKAIVTLFNGLGFSDARQIAMRDMSYMASEIRRSWKNYSASMGDDAKFIVVSNNRDWLSSFYELNLVKSDDSLLIDQAYPVLEGLASAKFSNNFILPKDLAFRKKAQKIKSWLFYLMFIVASLSLSGGIIGFFWFKKQQEVENLVRSTEALKNAKEQVASSFRAKLVDYLKHLNRPNVSNLYTELVSQLPDGYEIKEFGFSKSLSESLIVWALIIPQDLSSKDELLFEGKWGKAKVSYEQVNDNIGTRLTLVLGMEGR